MSEGRDRAGMALAAALGGAEGPLSADAGRTALLALIRLHEPDALQFLAVGEGPETGPAYNMASLFASKADSE